MTCKSEGATPSRRLWGHAGRSGGVHNGAVRCGRTKPLAVPRLALHTLTVAMHTADEFLGLTPREARAWAGALGWAFRDVTRDAWREDDFRSDRINVVFGTSGFVVWADIE